VASLARGVPCLEAHALWGSARALLLAALVVETRRPTLVVTAGAPPRGRAARGPAVFPLPRPPPPPPSPAPPPRRAHPPGGASGGARPAPPRARRRAGALLLSLAPRRRHRHRGDSLGRLGAFPVPDRLRGANRTARRRRQRDP